MAEVIDDTETFTIALTPPEHIPMFSVGDHICTDQEEIKHWFTRPREITGLDSTGYITEGLRVPFDWDQYLHICAGEEKCIGIYCPDKCDGTSLYSRKCVNGVCVNDALIEAKSTTCGYVPSDDEIYDEIDDDVTDDEIDDGTDDDVTDDTTDDDVTDLSSIFGDLDTKWIIIAVIALIILGLLS